MKSHLTFPEEELDELIDGETVLMLPHPNYNECRVRSKIFFLFDEYAGNGPVTAVPPRISVYLSERDRFIPDMMVVCDRNKIKNDGVYGAPDLVVEVLSPSTSSGMALLSFTTPILFTRTTS